MTSDIVKPVISRTLLIGFMIGWFSLFLLGFFVVYHFTAQEQQRDIAMWQRQLQLVAQSQRRHVDDWLNAQQSVVNGLANNTSLKLYLTELRQVQSGGADQAFTSFLSNLLISEAQQHGFYEPKASDAVPANLPISTGAGLAMVDVNGVPMVSTLGMPTLAQLPRVVSQAFRAKQASPIGPFLLNGSVPYLLFFAPISGVGSEEPQGYIVGARAMDDGFDALLALPPQASSASESLLVKPRGDTLHYISLLADGTKPLVLTMDRNTPDLAAAYGIEHPGLFAHKQDYRGQSVLMVAQAVGASGWTLVHKIDEHVAFGETRQRKLMLLVGYVLFSGLLTIVLVAIWRNVAAARARQAAMHYQQLSESAEKQRSLLSHLIDTLVMLVDSRDPHAQHHSNNVAMVAEAVAEHMALSPDLQETVSLAASLMNVGKINASQALLTGKDISSEDKDSIRQAMLASADILQNIAFEGPVVETLRQSLEHVDGSGPLGLKEDDLLISAKIIAVANAFVAMISKRSYRDAMTMEQAFDVLHKSVDTLYARSVVAALEHYVENDGGRQALADHL